jgi:hypothetical protein
MHGSRVSWIFNTVRMRSVDTAQALLLRRFARGTILDLVPRYRVGPNATPPFVVHEPTRNV